MALNVDPKLANEFFGLQKEVLTMTKDIFNSYGAKLQQCESANEIFEAAITNGVKIQDIYNDFVLSETAAAKHAEQMEELSSYIKGNAALIGELTKASIDTSFDSKDIVVEGASSLA